MKVTFAIKNFFFDRDTVIRAVSEDAKRGLSKFGAFVRRTAQLSIRTRKRISTPGSPPSSHTGLLKRFIYFGFDPVNRSVVIGPVAFSRTVTPAGQVLEHGGRATRVTRSKSGATRTRTMNYAARPFMRPAFVKERSKLGDVWSGTIKKG